MKTITVNGKERKYKMTFASMEKIVARYNTSAPGEIPDVDVKKLGPRLIPFYMDLLWESLVWPKPWLFRRLFNARLDLQRDIKDNLWKLTSIFMLVDPVEPGDREGKNGPGPAAN